MTRAQCSASHRMTSASALTIVLLLCACSPAPSVHTIQFLAMGTTVSISVADTAPKDIAKTLAGVESHIERLGQEWYPWAPSQTGELARLNAAIAQGHSAEVSPELAVLLREATELAAASGGRFDPAIGSLVELWGFTTGERHETAPLPDPGVLASWVSDHPSYADLVIEGNTVGSRDARLKLDLGAIAKGRIVDLASRELQAQGVTNALITAGGNVRAMGTAPGRPWRVAIRNARAPGVLGWIDLKDGDSVDTSGDYERFAIVEGRRIHHLLDPRTGAPTDHTASVTVIARNGTLADAAATAVFVAGPDDWQNVAHALGIQAVLRIDNDGRLQATHDMAVRVHWQGDLPEYAAHRRG